VPSVLRTIDEALEPISKLTNFLRHYPLEKLGRS